MKNYFELFSLPQSFDVNLKEIERKYFDLQKQYHPDRFVSSNHDEKIKHLQNATIINDAYDTLRDTLKRAEYLLFLKGIIVNRDNASITPCPMLLMEIMEYREALAGADNIKEIQNLENTSQNDKKNCICELRDAFENNNIEDAAQLTMRLKYLEKLADEIRIKRL